MRYCTKCGNQMADEIMFCQNCGTEAGFVKESAQTAHVPEESPEQRTKIRTSMKVWMIICFVFTAIFAIGATSDASMLAGVCAFGVLGIMFLFLAKTPKGSCRMFSDVDCFKKTHGITKSAFVCLSIFLSLFLFAGIINAFEKEDVITENAVKNELVSNDNTVQKHEEKEPVNEFSGECPINVSASLYDNIIGFPELSCYIKNKTSKEISAIQFYFVPKDVYGDELKGIFAQNRLQTDSSISGNGSNTVTWQMLEESIKSGEVYIYSVYFSDGTEWGNRNASVSEIKKFALRVNASY